MASGSDPKIPFWAEFAPVTNKDNRKESTKLYHDNDNIERSKIKEVKRDIKTKKHTN